MKDLIDDEAAKLLAACIPELRDILEVKEGVEISDMGLTSSDAITRLKSVIAIMFHTFAIRNKVRSRRHYLTLGMHHSTR